ncbi:MAG TPA: chorismate mutase [Promineifilum sp.]
MTVLSPDDQGENGPRLMCRGIRGATTVERDVADDILEATRELLMAMATSNSIDVDDIASIYFTTSPDLSATYPAYAARQIGWHDVALMCGHEMSVPDGLVRCIRVLMHWNTTRPPKEIAHVYLRNARSLRPDRKNVPPIRPRQMSPVEAAVNFLSVTL